MTMTDREKIVNQIDVDIQRAERTGEMLVYIGRKTAKDALALLKEQEAVKPKYTPPKSIYPLECGACAEPFDRTANYCPNCGRPVKWDE